MATTPSEANKLLETGNSSLDQIPKSRNEALAKKNTFETARGSEMDLARIAGLPPDLADMFFVKLGGKPYIKVAGLQYIAGKMGYRSEITDSYDKETETWVAECKIYPKISRKAIDSLSRISPDMQKEVFEEMKKPTNGIGTASKKNVSMSTMHAFLREMAQTRAMGRALRAFTGYGSAVYEELPEAEIKVE